MQFYDPTYRLPGTVPYMRYPAWVIVEDTLCVLVISRWRDSTELVNSFLAVGYLHLPPNSLVMFGVEEVHANGLVIGLFARFTNRLDAYFLLDKVFSCGCEVSAFTSHNIFTNFDNIFPTVDGMHTLPYNT
ncbi:Auxin-induced protein 5NG4 [Hordeum vulgare]|nr:Auxin-induced protein 5NG4 [Hordeum vulgare]